MILQWSRSLYCRRRRLWWDKIIFLFVGLLGSGLRVVDRVFVDEGFEIFGSSVVGLSATKEENED